MDRDAILRGLSESSIGKFLGLELCRELVAKGSLSTWTANSVIFEEGDKAIGMYIVAAGQVKLTRYSADGREVILHIAKPFMHIAEAALFLGKYPASAVTLEETSVVLIHKDHAEDLLVRYPAYAKHIFKTMSYWLKRLVDKIDQLTLNDATARVVHFILELYRGQAGTEHGTVTLPVKKGELAVLLNMNQATLSRAFRHLQDKELLDVRGKECYIRDLAGLKTAIMTPIE